MDEDRMARMHNADLSRKLYAITKPGRMTGVNHQDRELIREAARRLMHHGSCPYAGHREAQETMRKAGTIYGAGMDPHAVYGPKTGQKQDAEKGGAGE